MAEQRRERPHMPPNYGIAAGQDGMLSWEWVSAQMEQARNYWVCSTRPDGRPHAMPGCANGLPSTRR